MKKSPIHSQSEACYYDAYGFDLQEDFSQFLEEARNYEMKEAKLKSSSSVHPEGGIGGKKGGLSEKEKEKSGKKKKSWKSSVISWWKAEKKSKSPTNINSEEEPKGSCGKKSRNVSGPIYNSRNAPNGRKQWRPHSGPLITSLFCKSTKRENGNEIPYVSLQHQQQQNSSQDLQIQNFGPLYIVS